MPRLYSSASDPIDFCTRCFPSEATAVKRYGNVGDGPDGRGNCFSYDDEHPAYDGEQYRCANPKCRRLLTDANA